MSAMVADQVQVVTGCQRFVHAAGPVPGQPFQRILELGVGVMPVHTADWIRLMTAAARRLARKLPANSQVTSAMAIGRSWYSI